MPFNTKSLLESLDFALDTNVQIYAGGLKKVNGFVVLENYHFLINDWKEGKVDKKKYVLFQFVTIRWNQNKFDHLLIWTTCLLNPVQDTKITFYQQDLSSELTSKEEENYCIHLKAVGILGPLNHFPIHAGMFPFKMDRSENYIQEIHSPQHWKDLCTIKTLWLHKHGWHVCTNICVMFVQI